jgi:hypothetical protein
MTTYFILIDSIRRHSPSAFSNPFGQFLASSCSATFGFWLMWPFEVLKNQVQAHTQIYDVAKLKSMGVTPKQLANMGTGTPASAAGAVAAASSTAATAAAASSIPTVSSLPAPITAPTLLERTRYLLFTHGITGMYRGIGPGTARSMLSNGVSMVVMLHAQRKITQWGWRE